MGASCTSRCHCSGPVRGDLRLKVNGWMEETTSPILRSRGGARGRAGRVLWYLLCFYPSSGGGSRSSSREKQGIRAKSLGQNTIPVTFR